jgi:hypothetical protein
LHSVKSQGTLIRVNPQDLDVPQNRKCIAVPMGGKAALEKIASILSLENLL